MVGFVDHVAQHETEPKRNETANGIDPGRLALLLAVLEKRVGLGVGGQDVFVNVAGGLCLEEPAADLGVAAAVASSWRDRPIDARTVIFGEIGLAGEMLDRPHLVRAQRLKARADKLVG